VKEDVHKAICVNCKGANSAAFRGCSKYQEVIKAMMVSVTQKVSYRDALIKVKSDGELQRSRRHHRSSTVGRRRRRYVLQCRRDHHHRDPLQWHRRDVN